jgi:hypothetical protein
MIKDWDEIKRGLIFNNPLVRDYWQEEVRLHCAASLLRLQAICQARGADYDKTVKGLMQ